MPILVPEPTVTTVEQPSPLGDLAYAYLPRYMRTADDGTVLSLLRAAGAPVTDALRTLTEAAATADPLTTPYDRLAWLAAIAGIDVSTIADEGAVRTAIGTQAWRFRGCRSAIVLRVGQTLTGQRRVFVECPYLADPLKIRVRTYAAETPDADVTEAAIRAEVPAWLALTVDVAAGMTWDERKAAYTDWDDEKATGGTWNDLALETP